jgi:glycosyltransferase involved in cell wall biosynthesis
VTPRNRVLHSHRRFIFIGRLTDIKGAHILTEAVRLLPHEEKIEVLLVGAKGPDEYLERIQKECAQDHRVKLVPPAASHLIPNMMRDSDAVIIPSLWPETGPYTVLEASLDWHTGNRKRSGWNSRVPKQMGWWCVV